VTRLRSLLARASFGNASPRPWPVLLLALGFLALHLLYLPASLEDLDSINFALGVRQFDVAHHQPHPPGYPLFIAAAKAIHTVVPSEVTALALVSVAGGTLGLLALAALFRRLDGTGTPEHWLLMTVAVAATTPLYWFTAVRPLSDSSGLAAALAVQVLTLSARNRRSLGRAAFCAGLAAGVRSQVVWLTVPLLMVHGLRPRATERQRRGSSTALSLQPVALILTLFIAGLLSWLMPLLAVSGGPLAYWHALFDQGAEDLGNIQMLWTRHGPRDVVDALYYAFVAPWAVWPVAVVALTCALAGAVRLARRQRHTLVLLGAAFLPYLVFDLLFQETFTSRYALPLIVPMAYLVVAGLRILPWDTGLAVAAVLAMFCAHLGGTSIAADSRTPAPAFRLLDAMAAAVRTDRVAPVLAMDRREALDLRRPIKWIGAAMPEIAGSLPTPPQHEWLEAVKYWNGGGRAPVWFVVDPLRTSIDLVQHGDPQPFRWTVPYPVLLGGARPGEMDWYRVDRPEWYVGEGWALTPETAGVAEVDHRGPSDGVIEARISGASAGGTMMIGGRSFDPTQRPRLKVTVDTIGLVDKVLMPGAFLETIYLPHLGRDIAALDYLIVRVEATGGGRVAIEQFDASPSRQIFGFGPGWHERELNPRTGLRWRWLSERGELKLGGPGWRPPSELAPRPADLRRLRLHLEGESPRSYFRRGSRLVVRSGDRVAFDRVLTDDFALDVPIENAADTIVLETDQTYTPAERSRRSHDRRHLGLRLFKVELRKAAGPVS
jgi:hypothetical protein